MFNGSKGDRRRGYQLLGHLGRVLRTKGTSRVAVSLGGTALIAAFAFARCRSSSITGPSTPATNQGTAQNGNGGSPPRSNDLGTPTNKFGPIRIPFTVLPESSPCTGQPIVWDPTHSFTMMQGTNQVGTDGSAHYQYHMNTQAQGITNVPTAVYRQYVGSEEYNSQEFVFTTPLDKYKVEWNVKMIAKGEDGTIHDEDDFFIHIIMNAGFDPTQADITSLGYCK